VGESWREVTGRIGNDSLVFSGQCCTLRLRFQGVPIFWGKDDGPEIGSGCCELKRNQKFVVVGPFRSNYAALASHSGLKILQDKFLLGNEFHAQSEEPTMSVDHLREGRFAEKISTIPANRHYNCDS
jgi:hypothetical protein